MKKEALTAFQGFKLAGEEALRIKKTSPRLLSEDSVEKLPAAIMESVKKHNPKLPQDTAAFLLYFTGSLSEYFSGEYGGQGADKKNAAKSTCEGLKAFGAAYDYLMENDPAIFSQEKAVMLSPAITGFIDSTKYKISPGAREFLDQLLGFISFNLEKGFIQYDPAKKSAPRQMELF
jgi:hypothetical protein